MMALDMGGPSWQRRSFPRRGGGGSAFMPYVAPGGRLAGPGGGYRMDEEQVSPRARKPWEVPSVQGPYNEYYSSLNGPIGQDAPGSLESWGAGYGQAEGYRGVLDALDAGRDASVRDALARRSMLEAQYGAGEAHAGVTERNLRDSYGLDVESLGIRDADIGLDRARNSLKLEGLGVDRRENETDREYTARVRGINRDAYEGRRERILFDTFESGRALKDEGTAAGALFSPGYGKDQAANTLRGLSDLEAERRRWEEAEAGYDRTARGYDYRDERIGLSEREIGLANEGLDNASRALGIDRRRLEVGLEQSLSQLGLDRVTSLTELMAGVQSSDAAVRQANLQLLDQLISVLPAGMLDPAAVYGLVYGGGAGAVRDAGRAARGVLGL